MRRIFLLASLALAGCGSTPARSETPAPEEEPSAPAADGAATDELTAAQLRAVVTREQPGIRRCYEHAAIAEGRAPGLRLDVAVTIGPTGRVTTVDATGPELGTLRGCVEDAMRGWTFPPSSGTTRTRIPYVFQGRDS